MRSYGCIVLIAGILFAISAVRNQFNFFNTPKKWTKNDIGINFSIE